jgi:hypothetical protein
MRTILAAMLLVTAPVWAARPEAAIGGKPAMAAHADHDHAAMMQGMGRPTSWTLYPTLKVRMSGESRESMKTVIMPQNIVAANVDAWSNNLKDENGFRQLPVDMGGAMLDKPANGGFHWLAAREEQGDMVRVASIVQAFGERGAKDPTEMFMQQKQELEIIPQPFPREHSRYRANEDWKFLVRFNGQPLAGQKVQLETSNGSMTEFVSDAQGMVTVHVPDDFRAEEEQKAGSGHNHNMGARRTADMVLATEHAEGGKSYLTAFNSSYGPNAYDQRNMAMGVGFTLLGMLGAVPLLRKRKNGKNGGETENA